MPMVVPKPYLLEQSQFEAALCWNSARWFLSAWAFQWKCLFSELASRFPHAGTQAHYHSPACFSCYNEGSVSISIRNPLVSGLKHFQMVLDVGKQFVSGVPKKDFNTMHI